MITRHQIEERALDVLRAANAYCSPVDLDKVAKTLGVEVHYDPLEDHISGVLIIRSGERHALINGAHHPNRRRFSLAHELGHLVLHDSKGDRLFIDEGVRLYQRIGAASDSAYVRPGSHTTPIEEKEANMFASAVLMPKALVEAATVQLDLDLETDVAHLARQFQVSEQAMSIRLHQLGLTQPADFWTS